MKKTLLLLSLLFIASGCTTQQVQRYGPQGAREYSYFVSVAKSRGNSEKIEILSELRTLSLRQLLNLTDFEYGADSRDGADVIVEFDGVVTTLRRGWNIYIDGVLQNGVSLDSAEVQSGETVSLQYEELGTQRL